MSVISRLVPTMILLGTVTAIAQTPGPAPTTPAPAPTAAVNLTPAEMRLRSRELLSQAQEDYSYVTGLRERVRQKKDVIKLDCVNDRMIQIKAQLNIADKGNQSLQTALDREPTTSQQLFNELGTTVHSIRELKEQANQCVGEPELYKQEAGVEVTRPELPDDPGIQDPTFPQGSVVVEPPGYASAFQ